MFNWLHQLWFGYCWPSVEGNGPEAALQTVVYAILAVIFIPPVRRFAKAEFEKVHAKMDHVIKFHPDIPPFPGVQSTPKEKS